MRRVAHHCACGLPDVVETSPRLEDGTPFPTLFYLTCPKAASAIGRLEAAGVMREMTARLADDPELAAQYQAPTRTTCDVGTPSTSCPSGSAPVGCRPG